MKKRLFVGVLFSAMIVIGGIGLRSNVQAADKKNSIKSENVNYYYKADVAFNNFVDEPTTLTVNHYVDNYTGKYNLYKQEQYFDLSGGNGSMDGGLWFDPKEHYLDFGYTEWSPTFSHTNLDSEDIIYLQDNPEIKVINYYYKADVAFSNFVDEHNKYEPTTLTVNHYVDNYTGNYSLYKQEQYFDLSGGNGSMDGGLWFDPKEHYLDFSYTEWSPTFSHTNLDSDDIIAVE
ncbi:hypothetical protein [Enterococcus sp. LJL51]|uniref:hypothetical protein n=1 Tax=Enterococcus sp. LJL51 TaxID=3416656 RepID=UPI003CF0BBB1